MSHTLRKVNLGNSALVEVTIVDYPHGGEAFTLAELGLAGALQSVVFLKSYNANPQVNPQLVGGKVLLNSQEFFSQAMFDNLELPTTVGLNFTFVALVHGT